METHTASRISSVLQTVVVRVCREIVDYSCELVIHATVGVLADGKDVCTVSFSENVDRENQQGKDCSVKNMEKVATKKEVISWHRPQGKQGDGGKSVSPVHADVNGNGKENFCFPHDRRKVRELGPLLNNSVPEKSNMLGLVPPPQAQTDEPEDLSSGRRCSGHAQRTPTEDAAKHAKDGAGDEGVQAKSSDSEEGAPDNFQQQLIESLLQEAMRLWYDDPEHSKHQTASSNQDNRTALAPSVMAPKGEGKEKRETDCSDLVPGGQGKEGKELLKMLQPSGASAAQRHPPPKSITIPVNGKTKSGMKGKKLYECDICGSSFTFSTNLSRHKKRTHGTVAIRKGKLKQPEKSQPVSSPVSKEVPLHIPRPPLKILGDLRQPPRTEEPDAVYSTLITDRTAEQEKPLNLAVKAKPSQDDSSKTVESGNASHLATLPKTVGLLREEEVLNTPVKMEQFANKLVQLVDRSSDAQSTKSARMPVVTNENQAVDFTQRSVRNGLDALKNGTESQARTFDQGHQAAQSDKQQDRYTPPIRKLERTILPKILQLAPCVPVRKGNLSPTKPKYSAIHYKFVNTNANTAQPNQAKAFRFHNSTENSLSLNSNKSKVQARTKTNECPICRHRFTLRTNMRRHIRTIHKMPSYPLENCSEQMNAKQDVLKKDALDVQIKREPLCLPIKKEPFANEIVKNAKKTNKLDLFRRDLHLESTKLEPKCKDATLRKSIIHNNAFLGPGLFVCDLCGKCFSFRTNLCRHLKNIHKIKTGMSVDEARKKHTCRICNQSFTFSTNLSRHMKKTHKCTITEFKGQLNSGDEQRNSETSGQETDVSDEVAADGMADHVTSKSNAMATREVNSIKAAPQLEDEVQRKIIASEAMDKTDTDSGVCEEVRVSSDMSDEMEVCTEEDSKKGAALCESEEEERSTDQQL